jgi:hypothetical protein
MTGWAPSVSIGRMLTLMASLDGCPLISSLKAGHKACAQILPRIDSGKAFCVGLTLAGLALIGYSRASSLLPAIAIIAVTGAMLAGVNVAVSPLVLRVTPQNMIGRVESVISPTANLALIGSTALAGTVASTLLRGFHQTIAGISFGPTTPSSVPVVCFSSSPVSSPGRHCTDLLRRAA